MVAHAQKPDLVFQRNGRVHFYRRGCQFSRLLAAEVCASAVVMLDRPCPIQGKTAGYPLHLPFSPSLLHPCVSVCHQIPFLLYKQFAHNAVECARLLVLFSSYLLACLLRSLSPFPYATEVFFLPAVRFGKDSVFGRRSVRLFFGFFFFPSVWGSQTCFTFNDCGPGSCWCCPDFGVFCDWLIKFWQRHATVLLSLL